MKYHKIWREQYRATKGIKRRFGAKSALDYLIGEKLLQFAEQAQEQMEFAQELPRFRDELLFRSHVEAGDGILDRAVGDLESC